MENYRNAMDFNKKTSFLVMHQNGLVFPHQTYNWHELKGSFQRIHDLVLARKRFSHRCPDISGFPSQRARDVELSCCLWCKTEPTAETSSRDQVHYDDVIMGAIASQTTSLTIVYSTVYSDADQRKHQSSASLAFVWGIHRGPVNSPHKWPVTRKMFPFHDVIMWIDMALRSHDVARCPNQTLEYAWALLSLYMFCGPMF